MKALILNSGIGSRMGVLTAEQPKCMTEISSTETILSRQLLMLIDADFSEVIITTGAFSSVLINYVKSLDLPIKCTFVHNPEYRKTNYIQSIYYARAYLDDDILLLHGDMVFENEVLDKVLAHNGSCMTISSTLQLSEKDFKAVIKEEKIEKVGVEFFEGAVTAQPLYKLTKKDWQIWLNEIINFCESGKNACYAENAFNEVSYLCDLQPLDIGDLLCNEIDNPQDLTIITNRLLQINRRSVYMCFSTDILHSGHIAIIKKAKRLGRLIIGVLSDQAVLGYKRFPLLPFADRVEMYKSISGVYRVIEQKTISYKDVLQEIKPDYVVHGDDWQKGFQKPIRDEVIDILAQNGGKLVEFPYAKNLRFKELEDRARAELSLPDMRRSRLRKILEIKGTITALETHSGLTGLIVEKSLCYENGVARQFDAMWVSSLCDSTAKGKPDIELVDMTSRFRTIDDIMEVTTKPIIFDGDTGGFAEHFVYTVRTLERMGVSMIIIEDKTGLKKNSLFGTEVQQTQETIEAFSEKIRAGKSAQKSKDFMICARIESLILEKGLEDALERAAAFVSAGADAIMIHSRSKDPTEIFEFVHRFRDTNEVTPIVVVPTSFNSVTEEEFKKRGVNIIIYANQLTRSGYPAMQHAADLILQHHRAKECDEICMPFKDIIRLIPAEV